MRQLQNDPEKIRSFYQNHRSNMPPDSAFTYGLINNCEARRNVRQGLKLQLSRRNDSAMIRERVRAGLERAREQGVQLGRRRIEDTDQKKVAAILAARTNGLGIRRIARDLGVGVGTVLRLTGDAAGAH